MAQPEGADGPDAKTLFLEALELEDAAIDGWYICPHRPDAQCDCRKPGTALHREAALRLGLTLHTEALQILRMTQYRERGQRTDERRANIAGPMLLAPPRPDWQLEHGIRRRNL